MNLDSINLGKGIGDLTFGMNKQAVTDILGDEFEESVDENGDIELDYPQLHIHCTLWKDRKYKLGVISTERSAAVLLGKQIMGSGKDEMKEFISEKLQAEISEEDGYEHDTGDLQEWIDVDEKNLSFWFLNNVLYLVDCFSD